MGSGQARLQTRNMARPLSGSDSIQRPSRAIRALGRWPLTFLPCCTQPDHDGATCILVALPLMSVNLAYKGKPSPPAPLPSRRGEELLQLKRSSRKRDRLLGAWARSHFRLAKVTGSMPKSRASTAPGLEAEWPGRRTDPIEQQGAPTPRCGRARSTKR